VNRLSCGRDVYKWRGEGEEWMEEEMKVRRQGWGIFVCLGGGGTGGAPQSDRGVPPLTSEGGRGVCSRAVRLRKDGP